jgi:hypothetical protein
MSRAEQPRITNAHGTEINGQECIGSVIALTLVVQTCHHRMFESFAGSHCTWHRTRSRRFRTQIQIPTCLDFLGAVYRFAVSRNMSLFSSTWWISFHLHMTDPFSLILKGVVCTWIKSLSSHFLSPACPRAYTKSFTRVDWGSVRNPLLTQLLTAC